VGFSACVAHNSDTISTTDLKLQGYFFVFSSMHPFLKLIRVMGPEFGTRKIGTSGHLFPMDTCLSLIDSDMPFLTRMPCGVGAFVFVTKKMPLVLDGLNTQVHKFQVCSTKRF